MATKSPKHPVDTAKHADAIDAVKPSAPAEDAEDGAKGATVKLRDLVARVSEVSGGNKKHLKEVIEATLAQLGAALAKGEELNLPGLGKVRVARTADREGRTMMTLKVRSAGAVKPKEALAEAGEDV